MKVKFSIAQLERAIGENGMAALLSAGTQSGDFLEIDSAELHRIRREHRMPVGAPPRYISSNPEWPAITQPTPLPRAAWPIWAKAVALYALPGDAGLGDTITRQIGPIGGNAFKAWYLAMFGKPCGCSTRQTTLNARYPYDTNPDLRSSAIASASR